MSEYELVTSIANNIGNSLGKYRVLKPEREHVGFCGYLWQCIRGIFKYPDDQYYMYIGNPNIKNSANIWDFYFKQPHTNEYPPNDEIISKVGIIFDVDSEFVDAYPHMKSLSPSILAERKQRFGQIVKDNFQLLPHIQEKLDQFKLDHFSDKKVFGFHYRGTDHPDRKDITDSFPEIDVQLETHDLMFACSDERDIILALKSRYGDRMITYDESTSRVAPCDFFARSLSTETVSSFRFNALINWEKDNPGYKIGEDLIMETYLLASTEFLLCSCNSNVNYFIRVVNTEMPYKVIFTPNL
jgi:hypothetical protein